MSDKWGRTEQGVYRIGSVRECAIRACELAGILLWEQQVMSRELAMGFVRWANDLAAGQGDDFDARQRLQCAINDLQYVTQAGYRFTLEEFAADKFVFALSRESVTV